MLSSNSDNILQSEGEAFIKGQKIAVILYVWPLSLLSSLIPLSSMFLDRAIIKSVPHMIDSVRPLLNCLGPNFVKMHRVTSSILSFNFIHLLWSFNITMSGLK